MASPLLTNLVDSIVLSLNTEGIWSDLTIGTSPEDFMQARPCMDPENMFEAQYDGLYIVPVTVLYNREASQGRKSVISLNRGPVVAVCMSCKFSSPDYSGLDISTWDGAKQILNLREEIDTHILTKQWSANIVAVTAEPAQEIPLKERWFSSVTEYEFEAYTC